MALGELKPKGRMAQWVVQPDCRTTDCSRTAEQQTAAGLPNNRLQPDSRTTDCSRTAEQQTAASVPNNRLQPHCQPQTAASLPTTNCSLTANHKLQPNGTRSERTVMVRGGHSCNIMHARTRETSCISKGARLGGADTRNLYSDFQTTPSRVVRSTHACGAVGLGEHCGGLCTFIPARIRALSAAGTRVLRRSSVSPAVRAGYKGNHARPIH